MIVQTFTLSIRHAKLYRTKLCRNTNTTVMIMIIRIREGPF